MIVERHSGPEMLPFLDDLARLRIEVFREFPYLYEGSLEYELHYLKTLSESARGVLVTAKERGNLVGASTGMPLGDAEEAFREPFLNQGLPPDSYFYFAESVLQRSYRGQGLGRQFFQHREAHVRQFPEFENLCFCAVDRPEDHPQRPPNYRPLDEFWGRVGFIRHPELVCRFPWRDLGEAKESEKPLTFWLKALQDS